MLCNIIIHTCGSSSSGTQYVDIPVAIRLRNQVYQFRRNLCKMKMKMSLLVITKQNIISVYISNANYDTKCQFCNISAATAPVWIMDSIPYSRDKDFVAFFVDKMIVTTSLSHCRSCLTVRLTWIKNVNDMCPDKILGLPLTNKPEELSFDWQPKIKYIRWYYLQSKVVNTKSPSTKWLELDNSSQGGNRCRLFNCIFTHSLTAAVHRSFHCHFGCGP